MSVHLDQGGGEIPPLAKARGLGVYRTAQESLSNARRHSAAQNVWITLAVQGAELVAKVKDDGSGFDVETSSAGMGLRSMRQRATFLKGVLTIKSGDQGTEVTLRIPVSPSA